MYEGDLWFLLPRLHSHHSSSPFTILIIIINLIILVINLIILVSTLTFIILTLPALITIHTIPVARRCRAALESTQGRDDDMVVDKGEKEADTVQRSLGIWCMRFDMMSIWQALRSVPKQDVLDEMSRKDITLKYD